MATTPNSNINIPYSQFLDATTGRPSLEWLMWLMNPSFISVNIGGGLPVTSGGTGLTTIPTNGQLLIGNGTGYTLNTLGYGSGISVTNGSGTITVANTGVLSNIAGSGISVSSATGNVTVSNTGVLSWSGGSTGLTPASPTTGNVTLGGTLVIANGGTNGSATPTAYGVAYGTGTAYAFTAAGTAKQVLIANSSAAPTWSTLTTGTSILYGDGSGGFSNVTIGSGVSFVAGTLSATGSGGTVTSVTGTSPVVSSGGTTPAISLAAAYGDTLNPFGTKTAAYVLAGPATGAATAPTFRALVSTDIPSLSYVTSVGATAPITSTGGLTPTIGVTSAALSKTDDTNVTVTLGGSPTTALLAATSLTLGWSGQLSVGRGGTGLSAGTSGGIPYFSSTSAMTSSALLTQYGVVYGGGAGASPVATAAGTTGQILTATTGGAPTWANPATSGTVTSVSFTGGIITVATATTTPALTVAGTSGGIPYFSSATTWATSAALAANSIVLGGGAGAAPATTTTGTGVVTALGVNTGTAGAFVVNGGALGTPSSGTVTNLTGTASININGTVGATTANTGAFTTLSATGVTKIGGNLLVGTTTDFTTTTVAGGAEVAGYGIYPYVATGTTNTATYSGINWFTPTAFSGNNGSSSQTLSGIISTVNIKNDGSGGINLVRGDAIQGNSYVESTAIASRVRSQGALFSATRYSATDLSTRTDNQIFGAIINVNHNTTAPGTIVSSNFQAVSITASNNSGTATSHIGVGSTVTVGNGSGAPTTASTSTYAFISQTYTVGQASGNTATVTTGSSFYAVGPTVAATGTMTTYYGLFLGSATVTGTLTNNWGVYSADTAATNYFGGTVGIGTTSPAATAILDVQSTTKGVRFPNMTTAQKTAITPAAGTVVFDTTLAKLCVYSGAAWQTITSI